MSDEAKAPTVEELEERAAKRKEGRDKLEREQLAKDLLAREDLEEEHDVVATVKVSRFRPGYPTFALVKTPGPAQYKRFKDQVHRAADKKNVAAQQEAAELLAKSCWVYPAPSNDGRMSDAQNAMLEQYPGLLTSISIAAAALAEGKTVEEGKG